jgi:surfactin synthase thioesterase subunit
MLRRAGEEPVRVRLLVLPETGFAPTEYRKVMAPLPADVEVLALLPSADVDRDGDPGSDVASGPDGDRGFDHIAIGLDDILRRGDLPTVVFGPGLVASAAARVARTLGARCVAVLFAATSAGEHPVGPDGPAWPVAAGDDVAVGAALRAATERVARNRHAVLLCLPYAGAGAGLFRPWQRVAPPHLTVRGLQLPGRENRIAETLVTEVSAAVEQVRAQALAFAGEFDQVLVFGHSAGAVLAFEVALDLSRRVPGRLSHLIVSGCAGPRLPRRLRATGLPDDDFLARVREFAGYRDSVFDDPEMREVLLPVLRADVAMFESYRPGPDDVLDVPIIAIRGSNDALVAAAESARWADVTSMGVTIVEPEGPHMYIFDRYAQVLDIAAAAARPDVAPVGFRAVVA